MAGVSLSINRGVDGFKINDFTVGTAAPATADIELRYNVTDTNGKNLTRKDIILACQAFIRTLEQGQLVTNTPIL
jgi:hypothetical protein